MGKEKKISISSLLPQILCGLSLSFTVFVFGPIDMWFYNSADFWFGLEHFWLLAIVTFLIFFLFFELVFYLIRRFLPRPVYLILLGLCFGLSLMLYVQGNWLCMTNEVMLGDTPIWRLMTLSMIINTTIWTVVVIGSVLFIAVKPKIFYKVICYVCALVMVMEGTSLVSILFSFTTKDGLIIGDVYSTIEDSCVVSENGDVIVFMFDTLDTILMDEVLQNYPEYLEKLDGFTYYRNNGGLFAKTDPSFVGMLTGEVCKNEEPFFDFAHKAFEKSEFLPMLKENGFTVDIYSAPRGILSTEMMEYVDNIALRDSYIKRPFFFTVAMLNMVGYRYAPMVMQPFLHNEFASQLAYAQGYSEGAVPASNANDAQFNEYIQQEGLTVDNDRRFFKFYKMRGSHAPWSLNREGERVKEGEATEIDQTLGVFTIIGNYLQILKDQGTYDSSTIIIVADHGRHSRERYQNPTLLVKYPGETTGGELPVSSAPTSLLDLRATVLYGAGIENYADVGTPVHEWEGVESRERYFYDYKWMQPSGDTFYLDTLTEYEVAPDATDWSNYRLTGKTYSEGSSSDVE